MPACVCMRACMYICTYVKWLWCICAEMPTRHSCGWVYMYVHVCAVLHPMMNHPDCTNCHSLYALIRPLGCEWPQAITETNCTGTWTNFAGTWTYFAGTWTYFAGIWTYFAGTWTYFAGIWTYFAGTWTHGADRKLKNRYMLSCCSRLTVGTRKPLGAMCEFTYVYMQQTYIHTYIQGHLSTTHAPHATSEPNKQISPPNSGSAPAQSNNSAPNVNNFVGATDRASDAVAEERERQRRREVETMKAIERANTRPTVRPCTLAACACLHICMYVYVYVHVYIIFVGQGARE
jgi:hypothetical protein